jgi:hypothetical protein
MSFFLKGKLRIEGKNPVTKVLEKVYTLFSAFAWGGEKRLLP